MNKKINTNELSLREKIGQFGIAHPTSDMSQLDKNSYGGFWSTGAILLKR